MKKMYMSNPVPVRAVEFDGSNFAECTEFAGVTVADDGAGGSELVLAENGVAKIISVNSVLYLDEAGLLHVVSGTEFHGRFTEYVEQTMDFGGALNLLKQGKKVTRKGWGGSAVVEVVALDGIQQFLAISSNGELKAFSPGFDSLLAEDWIEVFQGAGF